MNPVIGWFWPAGHVFDTPGLKGSDLNKCISETGSVEAPPGVIWNLVSYETAKVPAVTETIVVDKCIFISFIFIGFSLVQILVKSD